MFTHESFRPYQLSIEFMKIAMILLEEIPRGNFHIRDQLKRAATSIPLNIAEGTGKSTRVDRYLSLIHI